MWTNKFPFLKEVLINYPFWDCKQEIFLWFLMLTSLAEGWEGLIFKQMLELSWLLPRAPEPLVAFSHSESPDRVHCTWILQMPWQTCSSFGRSVPSNANIGTMDPPIQMQSAGWATLHVAVFKSPGLAASPSPADSLSTCIILKHTTTTFKPCTCLVYWIKAWVSMLVRLALDKIPKLWHIEGFFSCTVQKQ